MKKRFSMKRKLSTILAAVMVTGSLAISAVPVESCAKMTSIPVTVEGSIFGGSTKDPVKTKIAYSSDLLVKANNKKYNTTIAGLSAILSADSYFREKDLAKGTQNRVLVDGEDVSKYDHSTLLKKLGFTEVEYLETYKAAKYDYDGNDSATLVMAHGDVDKKHEAFVFVIRGCFSQQEWLSIYDPGADTPSYNKLTGQHPEWLKKTQNKGASVAVQRSKHFIEEFMKKYNDSSKKDVVLLTGHSRGGGLANLIGAEMEKNKKVKSFTYTFNTPGLDLKAVPGKNKTIYNILEENDIFINPLPFRMEKFRRYGTDVIIHDQSKVAKKFLALTGREMPKGFTSKEVTEFKKLFSKRFKNRASLYKMHTITETFDDEQSAQKRYDDCLKLLGADAGLALDNYCSVGQVEKVADKYQIKLTYCDAVWLVCYAKTLAYGSSAHDAAVSLLAGDQGGCKVADFLASHAAQINASHLLSRTYVISQLAGPKNCFR